MNHQTEFEKEGVKLLPFITALLLVHSNIKRLEHAQGIDGIHYDIPSLTIKHEEEKDNSMDDDDFISLAMNHINQDNSIDFISLNDDDDDDDDEKIDWIN
jgi:hypothetical protein